MTHQVWMVACCAGWLGLGALHAQSESASSGFKVTYGVKSRTHGATWNGGVEDTSRVRRILGWHLHEDDQLRPPNIWDLKLRNVSGDIAAPAVILDLLGPESTPVTIFTRRGDLEFTPGEIAYGTAHSPAGFDGNVTLERVPLPTVVSSENNEDDSPALIRTRSGEYWLAWIAFRTRAREGFFYTGADEVLVARSVDGLRWSQPISITPPGDHFRVALGEDAAGRIWCAYGLQREQGSGDFNLYGRRFDDGAWSDPIQLTADPRPDAFHRLAGGQDHLYLVWMGYRDSPDGGRPQSDILVRRLDGDEWTPERNLTLSAEDDWEPSAAVDRAGRLWVGWDSYQSGGYDVFLQSVAPDGLGDRIEVATTPYAEMRASVAVDGEDQVWIAWEEAGANWGKDTGYQNPRHRIQLKTGGSRLYGRPATGRVRKPRVAVLQGQRLLQPAHDLEHSAPEYLDPRLFQNPRLAADGKGRIWVILRHQWRAAGRWGGHLFDLYATTWGEDGWLSPILLPGSTGRQDTVVAAAPGADGGLVAAVVGDQRRLPVALPKQHDISVLSLDPRLIGARLNSVRLIDFQPPAAPAKFAPTHPNEAADLARIRDHRVDADGARWKIVRGDLHRHTEISMDGATDGTLFDAYRYALNAADLDFLGVSDHNYGQWLDTDEPEDPQSDSEFQWWRAQKAADLFYVPGRFTPLYGYERTLNFPLGHRNVFHSRRGVFSLKVPRLHVKERPELIDRDPPRLWAYLRQTGGIGIPHTSATSMGTDWKRRDDEVVPVTEIYQGDRNSYETQGGPRAALPESPGLGQAGRSPHQKGLVWNALGVGYRMGFIASSDHYSTHISYANLIVPDRTTTREDLIDAIRNRRTYASTDNIVVDFLASGRHQGSELTATESPEFLVAVQGTAPILRIEIVKNNLIVFQRKGEGRSSISFNYRDLSDFADTSVGPTATIEDWQRPETGIRPRPQGPDRYYYVRVIQSFSTSEPDKEGEVAWSSPIYVRSP